jgi:SAM-dependent methyltransferase
MSPRHPFAEQWNHNTHYYPLLRSLIPPDAATVVDVGCGEGTLARFLEAAPGTGRTVLGTDIDSAVLPRPVTAAARFVAGSALSWPLATATVDAMLLVMVLHHIDPMAALTEARRTLRPGGRLLILGLGAPGGLRDLPAEVRDTLTHRLQGRGKRSWEPPTVKADPSMSWAQTRSLLSRELPGCHYRRLPMWRYLLSWTNDHLKSLVVEGDMVPGRYDADS